MVNEIPYAYAKACGIIGKSFVGKRFSLLAGLHSLSELDRLVFPENYRELPGMELLADLENRIIQRAVRQIYTVVNVFSNPPELLVRMLRAHEYSDLKTCLHDIAVGKKDIPPLCNIGRFQTIRFEAFPDITAMLKNTEFEFLLSDIKASKLDIMDITKIETKLDNLYYLGLADSLARLPFEDRGIVQRLLVFEISLRNCAWALRLRSYYNKTAAEAGKYLINMKVQGRSLVTEALESLNLPLDSRYSWNGWKWEKFLNPEEATAHWSANPRYFQNAASQYLYQIAMRNFHTSPMEISAIFCYIKLKQFEEDLLTSLAEGLALGMDSSGVFRLLEGSL